MNVELQFEKLSPGALLVLDALLKASSDNGHDFGLMCDANRRLPCSDEQFAGHVAHLEWAIDWRYDCAADPGIDVCDDIQFGLIDEVVGIDDVIAGKAAQLDAAAVFGGREQ